MFLPLCDISHYGNEDLYGYPPNEPTNRMVVFHLKLKMRLKLLVVGLQMGQFSFQGGKQACSMLMPVLQYSTGYDKLWWIETQPLNVTVNFCLKFSPLSSQVPSL